MHFDVDVAVVGAGISGLCFAHRIASAGLRCLVFEEAPEPGGCIHTVQTPDGFWFELGAHTLYNSYGSLLEIIEAVGWKDRIQRRDKAPFRLLIDGKVHSVPSQLAIGELLASAWRVFVEKKSGRTVEEYYGRLVGKRNWQRVFGPLLAAVPSQRADAFPAEMLFKRRPRRKDFPRTFTFQGGLSSLVRRLVAEGRFDVRTNAPVLDVRRDGSGFAVDAADGAVAQARTVVMAAPPATASRLLAKVAPEAARALSGIATADVVTTGVAIARQELAWPRVMGLAAIDDLFFSVVTRDVVKDDSLRGLAFHFRSGLTLDQRLDRIASVTGQPRSGFLHVAEHAARLPSPVRGHGQIVAAVDAAIAGRGVYVTGNYFGGLAIEDCSTRSREESRRLLRDLQRE